VRENSEVVTVYPDQFTKGSASLPEVKVGPVAIVGTPDLSPLSLP